LISAALDLGSNSFLCLISKKSKSGELVVIEDKSIITRLGQGVQKEGKVTKEALVRAAQAFTVFKAMIENHKAELISAVTTAAAREASNFNELQALGLEYGIPIEVISGEREAELSFSGAVESNAVAESLLLDIGGGSTEMAYYKKDGKLFLRSLPLGSVRLGEMFVTDWAELEREDLEKMRDQILKTLELSWESDRPPLKKWVAVAGTPTSLKAVQIGEFNVDKINGSLMSLREIKEINSRLLDMPLTERRKTPGLQPKRADVIPVGGLILETLMIWAKVEEIEISTGGLRYGLAKSFT
jgi:exopolyphosphatase/guanosine-5'-triphosphate,3'-diphosphate pyrophosphatase